jgi:hypothetical protein
MVKSDASGTSTRERRDIRTFLACGQFESFERAFYHSAVNDTSLGYGDVVMAEPWRLLGPLETMDGMLLFGISAAIMFTVLSRLVQQRLERFFGVDPSRDRRDSAGGTGIG